MEVQQNYKIIEILLILKKNEIYFGDNKFKIIAYDNAINNFKKKQFDKIGSRIKAKIEIIKNTGTYPNINEIKNKIYFYDLLSKYKGFGPSNIKKIINSGVTTIEQVKQYPNLTKLQLFSLNNNFPKISREQGKIIFDKIKKYLPRGKIIFAGSYRRKQKYIGDIDILIFTKNKTFDITLPDDIFIISEGPKKISFAYKLNKLNYVEIDLRFFNFENYGTALLYFTGPYLFNIEMRKKAEKMGYKLNEYSLCKNNECIYGKSEKEIFKILDMKYLPPEKR